MLNDSEKLLVEAINTMLQHDAKLGLSVHDNDESNHVSEIERGFQHLHGHITERQQNLHSMTVYVKRLARSTTINTLTTQHSELLWKKNCLRKEYH